MGSEMCIRDSFNINGNMFSSRAKLLRELSKIGCEDLKSKMKTGKVSLHLNEILQISCNFQGNSIKFNLGVFKNPNNNRISVNEVMDFTIV